MEANQIIGQAFQGLKLQDESNAQRVSELLDRFGLRWQVETQPLFLSDGTETEFRAIVRQDNNDVFATCKNSYYPFQNSELAELLIRISDKGGYQIKNGGMFKNGRKVYVQLISGNTIKSIGKNNDRVDGYTTGLTSHDGSISLKWGNTNITISCQNTFNSAARFLKHTMKHTFSMQSKIDDILREIDSVIQQEKSLFDTFIKLSEQPVKKNHIVKVVKEVTGVDISKKEYESAEDSTGYAINRTKELLTCIDTEMNQKGETLWGLFSGITNYTTHVMPVSNRDNARMESKYIGKGSKIDNKVLDAILLLN
jgi:phage/plasmid-like protein (TIGR03299 family)